VPKTIYLPKEDSSRSGVDITWTPSTQSLSIGGWYDGCVGIESTKLTLIEFFNSLGITEKDCVKSFKECAK
jgi:hypothetical protein